MARTHTVPRPRKTSEFEIRFASRHAEVGWRDLGTVVRDNKAHERWQHKPTSGGDARMWFYVDDGVVYLEQVHTHHPNETK